MDVFVWNLLKEVRLHQLCVCRAPNSFEGGTGAGARRVQSYFLRRYEWIPRVVPRRMGPSQSVCQVESLVFGSDAEELEALQCHVMAQMLMERSILEQEEDRGLDKSKG